LPLALIFAWAFELTPEGIKLEKEVDPAESITHLTGRKLDFAIIGLLAVAVIFLVVDNYILETEPEQATQSTIRLRDNREYGQLILSDEPDGAQRIIGAVLIGRTDGMGVLETLIRGQINVAPYIDALVGSGISHGAVSAWAQGKLPNVSQQLCANP
jgi:hypothetical protein